MTWYCGICDGWKNTSLRSNLLCKKTNKGVVLICSVCLRAIEHNGAYLQCDQCEENIIHLRKECINGALGPNLVLGMDHNLYQKLLREYKQEMASKCDLLDEFECELLNANNQIAKLRSKVLRLEQTLLQRGAINDDNADDDESTASDDVDVNATTSTKIATGQTAKEAIIIDDDDDADAKTDANKWQRCPDCGKFNLSKNRACCGAEEAKDGMNSLSLSSNTGERARGRGRRGGATQKGGATGRGRGQRGGAMYENNDIRGGFGNLSIRGRGRGNGKRGRGNGGRGRGRGRGRGGGAAEAADTAIMANDANKQSTKVSGRKLRIKLKLPSRRSSKPTRSLKSASTTPAAPTTQTTISAANASNAVNASEANNTGSFTPLPPSANNKPRKLINFNGHKMFITGDDMDGEQIILFQISDIND